MRLIEFGQVEDYQPLDRGSAFPQEHENGDRYSWWAPMDFNLRYWLNFVQWAEVEWDFRFHHRDLSEALMMGGEL